MNNDMMQQWADMNRSFMESMKQLGEITNTMSAKLTERQMAMVNAYMEGVTKQLQAMSEFKDMKEAAETQAKLAREFNQKLLENTQQTMEILSDTRSDLTTWMEQGMEAASKAVNESAKEK